MKNKWVSWSSWEKRQLELVEASEGNQQCMRECCDEQATVVPVGFSHCDQQQLFRCTSKRIHVGWCTLTLFTYTLPRHILHSPSSLLRHLSEVPLPIHHECKKHRRLNNLLGTKSDRLGWLCLTTLLYKVGSKTDDCNSEVLEHMHLVDTAVASGNHCWDCKARSGRRVTPWEQALTMA